MNNPLYLTTQPLSFLQYDVCTLHTALNEHSVLQLEGMIDEQHAAAFLAAYDEKLTLHYACEGVELQWCGIIKDVHISRAYGGAHASVTVYSETIRFDEQKRTRTFTNEATLQQFSASMEQKMMWHGKLATQSLFEPYTMQYEETDWQFLKRLASRYSIPFVLEEIAGQFEIYTYFQKEAYEPSLYDKLRVSSNEATISMLPIVSAQPIYYTGMQLMVEEKQYVIERAIYELHRLYDLHVQYELIDQYGVEEKTHPLAHTIFPATVLHTNDPQQLGRVAVCFEWEDENAVRERFIPWATPFSAHHIGFHALPSVGEVVYIMCAGKSEQQFVAYLAERTEPNELLTDEAQYWRTADGTEICLQPKQLTFSLQMEEPHVRTMQMSHEHIALQYDARHIVMNEQQLALTYSNTQQLMMTDEAATLTFGNKKLQMNERELVMTNEHNEWKLTDDAMELVRKEGIVRITDGALIIQRKGQQLKLADESIELVHKEGIVHITDQALTLQHKGQQIELTDSHIQIVGKSKERIAMTSDHIEVQYGKERVRLSNKGVDVQASTFTVNANKIKLKGKTEITS